MKKSAKIIILIVLAAATAACAHIGEMNVLDFKIDRISPETLRSVRSDLQLKIDNKGPEISIKSLSGEVFYNDVSLGTFDVDDFSIPAKGTEWVGISGGVTMDTSMSLVGFLEILKDFNSENMSISFDAVASSGVLKKKIHQQKLPVSRLIEKIKE